MSQFVQLSECGVPHHPVVALNTGDQYCQTVLHHMTIHQYAKIIQHLTRKFCGLPGTGHNDWSQATGRLGFIMKVVGSEEGTAHAEVVPMTPGIFQYP